MYVLRMVFPDKILHINIIKKANAWNVCINILLLDVQLQEHMQESQTQLQHALGQKDDSAGQEQAQQEKKGIKPVGITE